MQHTTNALGQPVGFPLPNWKVPEVPSRATMEGHYCRVEHLDPERHAASLHTANMTDPQGKSWTYLPYGPFETVDNYRSWAEEAQRSADPLFYAIIDRVAEKAVGVASFLRIAPASGSVEVG